MITPKDDEGKEHRQVTTQVQPTTTIPMASAGEIDNLLSAPTSDSESEGDGDDDITTGAAGDVMKTTIVEILGPCDAHAKETAIAFCETCKSAVCVLCMSDPTKNHVAHKLLSTTERLNQRSSTGKLREDLMGLVQLTTQRQQDLMTKRKEVKMGHKKEIQEVQGKEKLILVSLKDKFQKEVRKLEDAYQEQATRVQGVSTEKVQEIRDNYKLQVERIDRERKKAAGIAAQANTIISDIKKEQSSLKVKTESLKQAFESASGENLDDVKTSSGDLRLQEDFDPLDVFLAKVDIQGKVAALPDSNTLRKRLDALLPENVRENNTSDPHDELGGYRQLSGDVVITRDFHKRCRRYAENKTDVHPGPMECPERNRQYKVSKDVTYIPPEDAADVCAAVGGSPTVLVVVTDGYRTTHHWESDDKVLFLSTSVTSLKSDGRTSLSKSGYCCVEMNVYDAVEHIIGRRLATNAKSYAKVIGEGDTLEKWINAFPKASENHQRIQLEIRE